MVTDGLMAAYDKATAFVDKSVPRSSPRVRFVVKTVRAGPGKLLDFAEVATAEDKTRAVVGLLGGMAGGAAGGAMGAATGPAAPVAAPLGAAVGKVAGQHIAEEIYDDHADDIRSFAAANRRRIGEAKAWIDNRNAEVARGLLQDFETLSRPPAYRRRF